MKQRQATSRKRTQNNNNEDDLGSRKRMEAKTEKMQEMFTKDLEELKNEQTEMNNTLEGINCRRMNK